LFVPAFDARVLGSNTWSYGSCLVFMRS
jgi:hypothetical protein